MPIPRASSFGTAILLVFLLLVSTRLPVSLILRAERSLNVYPLIREQTIQHIDRLEHAFVLFTHACEWYQANELSYQAHSTSSVCTGTQATPDRCETQKDRILKRLAEADAQMRQALSQRDEILEKALWTFWVSYALGTLPHTHIPWECPPVEKRP